MPSPRWVRPALVALLVASGLLYLWALGDSGWANSYYSAAVQAGSVSWKAFLFGSSDPANAITVDKPPAALWVMALSVRLVGLNSWSVLVPQAIEGVATVALLYAAVRRWFGPTAGLLAGAVLAFTPVAALMFRYNNPDALLVLLLVAAAYAVLRAVETASTGWLMAAGALVGFGFLTKMLEALLVLPAFALTYLVAAPAPLRRRIGQLLAATAALVVSMGWWVAILAVVPASARPFVGGSASNSVLDLVFGYNGVGRLVGSGADRFGHGTDLGRMFGTTVGSQIAWLLPAALVLTGAGLWMGGRAPRTDRSRAALMLWGGWLIVTAVVFSLMQGIFHPYYTVAMAPAVGALVGIGTTTLWRRRSQETARTVLSVSLGLTAVCSFVLLIRRTDFLPWLGPVVLVTGVGAAAALGFTRISRSRAAGVLAAVAIVVGFAGPIAYALATAAVPHAGSSVSAGPAVGKTAALAAGRGQPGDRLVALLRDNAHRYSWVAAAVGSGRASAYQLASQDPVLQLGGFNGAGPFPTLAQFRGYVAAGRIHYFVGQGHIDGARTGLSDSAQIQSWVETSFHATLVDGLQVYDLT